MWKVYLLISFLHFSLSVQLNRSRGHHLGVMPVSITQWCLEIGIFHTRFSRVSNSRSTLLLCNFCTTGFYFVCCVILTLFISGDVELNPGPKNTKSSSYFSLCHWNLNSLLARDFSKLPLIEAYNTHHNFDMICLSKTYLDSSYADDDTRLNLKDFILIRADNPHNCNIQSSSWWKNDLKTSEVNQVGAITSSYGLSQLICEPRHILTNSSSCIDLIFFNHTISSWIVAFTLLFILIVIIK